MTQPSGRDLDVAIARALGWEEVLRTPSIWRHRGTDGVLWDQLPPLFHQSVDLLLRDVVPDCQRRGMLFWQIEQFTGGVFAAGVNKGVGTIRRVADTPAEALALALLSALEEATP